MLKRNSFTFLCAALVLSIGALPSHAAESETISESVGESFGISSQGHMIFASQGDPADRNLLPVQYLLHENRLGVEKGPYRLGVHFTNQMLVKESPASSLTQKPFTLEKKALVGEWEQWTLALGDSYQEYGKGIALSLYQDDVFGVNNTLEGGSIKFHPKNFEASGFAGRINSITSPVAVNAQENPLKNRTVYLFGGSVGGMVDEDTKLTAHYVLALNQPDNYSGFNKTWTTVGMTAQETELLSRVEAYGEINALFSHINVAGNDRELPRGWGGYSSVSWTPSPWKFKLEAKHYEDYVFEFRRPPTLEEDIVETTNIRNVTASRVLADYRFSEGKGTVGASLLVGYDREALASFQHGVANAKIMLQNGWDMEARAGYRSMFQRSWLAHASLKTKIKTYKGQYLELGYRKQFGQNKLDLLPTPENRNIWDVSYVFSERLSANIGYEYLPENDAEVGQHFMNVGSTIRWGQLSAKGMLGQTSGGTVCSAGVCRQVPPFSGALLETTYTF